AVTLHPRHRGQMFSGSADWGHIAALKKAFPDRIVIGNGDVRLPGDAARMISETGCDSVMVGRAAMGNPWIFASLKTELAVPPDGRRALILRHGEEMFLLRGPRGIKEMRKHLAWYSRGIPGAAAFRAELSRIVDPDSFRAAVERHF
ncbi:MAG: tRNA-dihydrouridine synthase, partial [Deltaproteobacteria bacterium]|nr:tRNA-dihydrouridine synthase [Deltaproteobacteria bacterium]